MMKKGKQLIYFWILLCIWGLAGCASGQEGKADPFPDGVGFDQVEEAEEAESDTAGERGKAGADQVEEGITMSAKEDSFFTGEEDIYSVKGEAIDYLRTIRAFDREGKELTEKIQVDASQVIQDECGEYEVHFGVEDEEGRRTETTCRVYIVEGEKAVPYYLDRYEPAFVRISSETEEGTVWGSGFVLDMDEGYLYVLTNAHVALQPEVKVYFYGGNQAVGEVLGSRNEPDMAVVKVSRGEEGIPEGIVAVDADLSHWESLDPDNLPAVGYRCSHEDGSPWIEKTGILLGKEEWMWALSYSVLSYTAENVAGASGSAVIDESGKLIAMALGASTEGEETAFWGIRLPDILEFYREVTGLQAG